MKYLVYPYGYDPLIPLGNDDWQRKPGIRDVRAHSPQVVQRQRELVKLAKVMDTIPTNRWYQEILENSHE